MSETSKRPGAVIFVAIVLFVFGGVCTVNAALEAWSAVYVAANPDVPAANAKVQFTDFGANFRFLADEIPGSLATIIAAAVIDILFGIAQIACGVGVLRLKPAARRGAVCLILTRFVYASAYDIFSLLVIVPAQIRFIELHPPALPQADQGIIKIIMTISVYAVYGVAFVGMLMQLLVTVLIVWLLNKASAQAAFAGAPPPADEPPPLQAPSLYTGYEDDETQPA